MPAKSINELASHHEIFTHIDDDGTVRHFDVTAMSEFALAQLQPELTYAQVAIDPEQVVFMRKNRGIEQPRIDRLEGEWLDAPIVLIIFDNDHSAMVVDGNHRFVKKGELGHDFIKALIFPQKAWERFLVDIPGCDSIVGHSGMGKSHLVGRRGVFNG